MAPKEKATELVAELIIATLGMPTLSNRQAKQCALKTVDEILAKHYDDWGENSEWWLEVKEEIKKIR